MPKHRMRRTVIVSRGFSLLELVVAMAIFMLISGAAISLFRQQQINSQSMTGQVALNLALRNAVSQLEMDVANAGSAYFQSVNMPSWPVGVTVVNNVVTQGNTCKTGNYTYGANCFDQLNVIDGANPNLYPPANVTGDPGVGATCSDTSTGKAYSQAAVLPNGTVQTLAATAAEFKRNDQILFMNGLGTKITTAVLTHDASVSGTAVKFQFNATNADGTNSGGPNGTDDPLDITTCEGYTPCSLINPPLNVPARVTNQFCAGNGDWVMKLDPIVYAVDITTDPSSPRLTRKTAATGARTVMEQIVGFKVGTTIWNDASTGTTDQYAQGGLYQYDASQYCNVNCPGDMAFNFAVVRSVRLSLIGRTTPDWRGTYTYRNGFDNGPYQVQGMAVVVNPRNLSMND